MACWSSSREWEYAILFTFAFLPLVSSLNLIRQGLSTWSPRLDTIGNSVRGVEFCKRLSAIYSFHHLSDVNTKELTNVTKVLPSSRQSQTVDD